MTRRDVENVPEGQQVLPADWAPYAYQEITAPDPAEAPEEIVV